MTSTAQAERPGQTTEQVAKRFKVTVATVRRWVKEDDLAGHKIGREIRYTDAEVERFARVYEGPFYKPNGDVATPAQQSPLTGSGVRHADDAASPLATLSAL